MIGVRTLLGLLLNCLKEKVETKTCATVCEVNLNCCLLLSRRDALLVLESFHVWTLAHRAPWSPSVAPPAPLVGLVPTLTSPTSPTSPGVGVVRIVRVGLPPLIVHLVVDTHRALPVQRIGCGGGKRFRQHSLPGHLVLQVLSRGWRRNWRLPSHVLPVFVVAHLRLAAAVATAGNVASKRKQLCLERIRRDLVQDSLDHLLDPFLTPPGGGDEDGHREGQGDGHWHREGRVVHLAWCRHVDGHWNRYWRWVGQSLSLSFLVTRVGAAGDALRLHERFALNTLVLHHWDLRWKNMSFSHHLKRQREKKTICRLICLHTSLTV